MKNRAFYADRD